MQKLNFEELIERIVELDPRYRKDAYDFLRGALDFTQKKTGRPKSKAKANPPPNGEEDPERHVTGQQLLQGIRTFALREFGPFALTVLKEWGITRCEDFGEMVFNLVDHQVLRKTNKDSRDDFKSGFDFEEAFRDPFLPPSKLARKLAEKTTTQIE